MSLYSRFFFPKTEALGGLIFKNCSQYSATMGDSELLPGQVDVTVVHLNSFYYIDKLKTPIGNITEWPPRVGMYSSLPYPLHLKHLPWQAFGMEELRSNIFPYCPDYCKMSWGITQPPQTTPLQRVTTFNVLFPNRPTWWDHVSFRDLVSWRVYPHFTADWHYQSTTTGCFSCIHVTNTTF